MGVKLKVLYKYAFGVLLLGLPLENWLRSAPNIIMIILAIMFPFVMEKRRIGRMFWVRLSPFFLFLLYVFLSSLYFGELRSTISFLGKLGLVFSTLFLGTAVEDFKRELKLFFTAGTTMSIVYSLSSILLFFYRNNTFTFTNGLKINELLLTERPYIAFFCVLSIIFSLEELKRNKRNKIKLLFLSNVILILAFLLLISARMGILTSMVVILFYTIRERGKLRIFWLSFLAVAVFFGIFNNKNLIQRFKADKKKTLMENIKIWEPRYVIWSCGNNVLHSDSFSWLRGTSSFEETTQRLQNCYTNFITNESKKQWFLTEKFNTHNQYLGFLLTFGIIGATLFLTITLYPLILGQWNNTMIIALIVSITFFGLVENYFERQLGAYLFGLFLYFAKKEES